MTSRVPRQQRRVDAFAQRLRIELFAPGCHLEAPARSIVAPVERAPPYECSLAEEDEGAVQHDDLDVGPTKHQYEVRDRAWMIPGATAATRPCRLARGSDESVPFGMRERKDGSAGALGTRRAQPRRARRSECVERCSCWS